MATDTTPAEHRDILSLIHDDHQAIDRLFARYDEQSVAAAKSATMNEIGRALLDHVKAAEELLYTSITDAAGAMDCVEEAYAEHAAACKTLEAILSCPADDPTYDMKVRMLQRELQHHVREEETELFEVAREAGLDLVALGDRFESRKAQLASRAAAPVPVADAA